VDSPEITGSNAPDRTTGWFASHLKVAGEERHGYRILTVTSPAVPNAIAAICLHLRDQHRVLPHVYFE
jgi:hypothetical protein